MATRIILRKVFETISIRLFLVPRYCRERLDRFFTYFLAFRVLWICNEPAAGLPISNSLRSTGHYFGMHAEYAWVSSMLATGNATDIVESAWAEEASVRGPRKVRTGSFVSGNLLGKEILIFYKNTVSKRNAWCLEIFEWKYMKDITVELRYLSRRRDICIFWGDKEKF